MTSDSKYLNDCHLKAIRFSLRFSMTESYQWRENAERQTLT